MWMAISSFLSRLCSVLFFLKMTLALWEYDVSFFQILSKMVQKRQQSYMDDHQPTFPEIRSL